MIDLNKIDKRLNKAAIKRVNKARDFPTNTCPYSRHAQMIGEALVKNERYAMLSEEPQHCGLSILHTVASLYEARAEVLRLKLKMEGTDR